MYREMKDSDKEKESGKMVRLPCLCLCCCGCLNNSKVNLIAVYEMLHLKKTNSFQLAKRLVSIFVNACSFWIYNAWWNLLRLYNQEEPTFGGSCCRVAGQ